MIILIILISIFIIMNKSDKKLSSRDDSIGHITKDAFLTTKEDFVFVEVNQQICKFF
jgi:hypothetical protein